MSNSNFLTVDKLYKSQQKLKKSHLDAAFDSIQSWANKNINDNNQFRKDIFGGNYTFDQDGYANLESPIFNLNAGSANTGTSALNWEFTGSVTLPQTFYVNQVSFDYTILFSNPSAARNITFADPGGHDSVVYLNATQTLSNKTFASLTVNSPLFINSSNDDSVLRFRLNGSDVASIGYDFSSNIIAIKEPGGSALVEIDYTGIMTINGFGVDRAELVLNSPANRNSQLKLSEVGTKKWIVRNNSTGDVLEFENASSSVVVKLTQSGELLLPTIDPPAAIDYINRNSVLKAWLYYTDGSGVVTNSYNIDSVGSDDGDGTYDVVYDVDMPSATKQSVVGIAYSDPNIIVSVSVFATTLVGIRTWDAGLAALADRDFIIMCTA